MWLLLAFLTVPLIEIGLFIQVGGLIGLWPTLAIVIITAVLGTWLVRTQGAMAMNDLRGSFSTQRDPTEPLAHGAMILIAGVLLLTPGFFTDAVGFALLMPPFRRAAFQYLRKRVKVARFDMGGGQEPHRHYPHDPGTIEGDFQEVDTDPHHKSDKPSGWTKH
ncbi:FxsA family protein [Pseudohalocynthiibacter aestuariivivens]|uniref:FxsA family protein n=1 Tax=Roseovarius pelagicus TaxID=2980108 RepID=A0ABY6D7K7_9RHOB|nr:MULTISPECIES: FxsA family protein [Rhodobacterales]QIE46163.1 FxsA family protein [Pseudohalocynthiibacter aestuariivivens]UXX81874.1 FxsA family protein [Roseovarius pelagicus]